MSRKKQVYLAGAIQKAPDQGRRWRTILQPQLEELGFEVFNPCDKTDGPILERFGWKKFAWDEIKRPENRELYLEVMREIVATDLEAIFESDIVIVYMDKYGLESAGTHGEMTAVARHNLRRPKREHIYVYVVLCDGIEVNDIPGWIMGCTDIVFESFSKLKSYLQQR